MALRSDNNKQLKIPRSVIAEMVNGNPQAVIALEKMQLATFDLLPEDIRGVIEGAAADAMQAAMIANQIRDQLAPYLQAVGVPLEQASYLTAVNVPYEPIELPSLDTSEPIPPITTVE